VPLTLEEGTIGVRFALCRTFPENGATQAADEEIDFDQILYGALSDESGS
jgi:hypothetical protein